MKKILIVILSIVVIGMWYIPNTHANRIEVSDEGWSKETIEKSSEEEPPTLDDMHREILQMTFQKIESKQLKELLGKDALELPFTPPYPTAVGPFKPHTEHFRLTEDNIKRIKLIAENVLQEEENYEERNTYYQRFLDEWLNEDYSNLVKVHEELMELYAEYPSGYEDYKKINDLRLATEQEEKAYIHYYWE